MRLQLYIVADIVYHQTLDAHPTRHNEQFTSSASLFGQSSRALRWGSSKKKRKTIVQDQVAGSRLVFGSFSGSSVSSSFWSLNTLNIAKLVSPETKTTKIRQKLMISQSNVVLKWNRRCMRSPKFGSCFSASVEGVVINKMLRGVQN